MVPAGPLEARYSDRWIGCPVNQLTLVGIGKRHGPSGPLLRFQAGFVQSFLSVRLVRPAPAARRFGRCPNRDAQHSTWCRAVLRATNYTHVSWQSYRTGAADAPRDERSPRQHGCDIGVTASVGCTSDARRAPIHRHRAQVSVPFSPWLGARWPSSRWRRPRSGLHVGARCAGPRDARAHRLASAPVEAVHRARVWAPKEAPEQHHQVAALWRTTSI